MKEKYFPKLVLLTPVLVSIFVTDKLLDPFNIGKLSLLMICSFLLITLTPLSRENLLFLKKSKFLLISIFSFIFCHFVTIVLSGQDFYRGFLGVWGRNNGLFSYLGLSVVLLSTALYVAKFGDLKLIKLLVYLGVFETIYGFLQWQDADFFNFSYIGSPVILTLGNENFSSLFLVLCLIATLHLASIEKSDFLKVSFYTLSFCQLFIIYIMDTAQSKLALVFSSVIFLVLKLSSSKKDNLRSQVSVVIGILLITFLTILGIFGFGLFAFINANLGSLYSRYLHWIAAWKMFQQNYIYGVGIDSYGDFQPFFRVLDSNGIPDTYSNNAHNLFFQILSTGGILLFLSFISILVCVGVNLSRLIMDKTLSISKNIFYLCMMGTMLINMVISIDNIALNVWLWAFMGATIGLSSKAKNFDKLRKQENLKISLEKKSWKLIPAFVIGLTLFVGILFCLKTTITEFNLRNSLVQLQNSADNRNIMDNLYSSSLNLTDPDIRMFAITTLYENGENDRAYELTLSALKHHPRNLRLLYSAFAYNQQYGKIEDAQRFLVKLTYLDPHNTEFKKLFEDFKISK